MGDPWQKKQVENFKKDCDRAIEQASEDRLIRLREVTKLSFTLKPDGPNRYIPGEKVIVMADASGVRVIRGYEQVGTVQGEGAEKLRQALSEKGGLGAVQLRVTEVAPLSRVARGEFLGI